MKKTMPWSALFVVATILCAFLVATSVHGASSAPPALERSYLCFEGETASEVMKKANEAGKRGWKLVAASPGRRSSVWCFEQLGSLRPEAN